MFSPEFLGNPVWGVLALLCGLALGLLGGWIALRSLRHRAFLARARGQHSRVLLLLTLARASLALSSILGLRLGILFLPPLPGWPLLATVVVELLLVLAVGKLLWDLALVLGNCIRRSWRGDAGPDVASLIVKALRSVIVVLLAAQVALLFGGHLFSTLLAVLGLFGLAIALAFRDSLADLAGTFYFIIARPFSIGDHITSPVVDGIVERFGGFSTRLRRTGGERVTVPNRRLSHDALINHTRQPFLRRELRIKLQAGAKPEHIAEAVRLARAILDEHRGSKPERPPRLHLHAVEADHAVLQATLWFHPPEIKAWLAESERLTLSLYHQLGNTGAAAVEITPLASPR